MTNESPIPHLLWDRALVCPLFAQPNELARLCAIFYDHLMDEDQMMTHTEAAVALGVSRSYLYTLRASAKLTVLRNSRGDVRYLGREISALAAEREAFQPDRDAVPA